MNKEKEIIKMLKQGDTYKRIQRTLLVSSKTISKANLVLKAQVARDQETARAMKKIDDQRKANRKALSNTLSTIHTKKPSQTGGTTTRKVIGKSKKVALSFIHVNQFKTWLLNVDRSKFHDSSASAIKRLVDHKRMAFLESYVALINEYLEGV